MSTLSLSLWVLKSMQSLWCVGGGVSIPTCLKGACFFQWFPFLPFRIPLCFLIFSIGLIKFKLCSYSASYMQFYTTMRDILCVPEPCLLFSHGIVQILGCISLTCHGCVSYNHGMSSVNLVPVSHRPVPLFLPPHCVSPVPGTSAMSSGLNFSAQHQYLSHK